MNLGALPMQQLADAVNWCNSTSYTPPQCVPWVDLPQSDSASSTTVIETSQVAAQSESTQAAVEAAEPQTSPQPISTEINLTPPSAIESEKTDAEAIAKQKAAELAAQQAKELAEQELAARIAREQAEKEAAQLKAASERAAQERAAVAAAEQAAKIAGEQAEAEALQRSKDELAQKAQAEEQAAKQRASEQAELERQESIRREAAAKREAEEREVASTRHAEERAAAEQEAAQRITEFQNKQAIERISAPIAANPAQPSSSPGSASPTRANNPATARTPIPERKRESAPVLGAALTRTTSVPATDDYLSQLERLVLELNMELARRNNEQQPADPIEQLTQRIIALNLENLALREQIELQKQSQ